MSTKLGVGGLATWLVLGSLAAGVAPPPEWPEDFLQKMYAVTKLEAYISVQFLSAAALATGIIAMAWSSWRAAKAACSWAKGGGLRSVLHAIRAG